MSLKTPPMEIFIDLFFYHSSSAGTKGSSITSLTEAVVEDSVESVDSVLPSAGVGVAAGVFVALLPEPELPEPLPELLLPDPELPEPPLPEPPLPPPVMSTSVRIISSPRSKDSSVLTEGSASDDEGTAADEDSLDEDVGVTSSLPLLQALTPITTPIMSTSKAAITAIIMIVCFCPFFYPVQIYFTNQANYTISEIFTSRAGRCHEDFTFVTLLSSAALP